MGCGGSITKEANDSKENNSRSNSLKDVKYENVNHYALKVTKVYKDQKIQEQGTFVDDLFPPNNNSIFSKNPNGEYTDPIESRRSYYLQNFHVEEDEVIWLRAGEIFPDGKYSIFEQNIEVDDIKQGNVGDCYFLSAIAAATEFPTLITQIFRTLEIPANGRYEIVMKINGIWKIVYLDDYFPCYKFNKQLIFCKPKGAEIWTMLLEKAWAKVNKGYLNIIGGWATDVLGVLTPFPLEFCSHKPIDTEEKQNTFWKKLRDADSNGYIMAANTKFGNGLEAYGLNPGHAFTLISAIEGTVDGNLVRLGKFRNPWGFREWVGDWSDNSNKWTPEAIKIFNFKKDLEDGIFWMSFVDFFKFFNETEICIVSSPLATIATQIPKERVEKSNIYELILSTRTKVNVSGIKKFYRYNRTISLDHEVIVNIIIVEKTGNELVYRGSASEGSSSPNLSLELESGSYLIYIFANYTTGKYDKKRKYVLFVSCDNFFNLIDRGTDDDELTILKEIMIPQIKKLKSNEMKGSYIQVSSADFENSTLGYLYIWNNTKQNYTVEGKEEMQNMFLLNKFSGSVTIPAGYDWIAIACRTTYYPGKYIFYINYTNNPTVSQDNSACIRNNKILSQMLSTPSVGASVYDFIYVGSNFDLTNVIRNSSII